jgi:hypothetical protein
MATKSVKIDDDSQQTVSSWINDLGDRDRVAILRNGEIVAGLVSPDELERLEYFERQSSERVRLVESIRQQFDGIPEEELISEAENAVQEARNDMEHERRSAPQTSSAAAAK